MDSGSEGIALPLISVMPVAWMAVRRSSFTEAKDWLGVIRRRIVVLCCLKRKVSWPFVGVFDGLKMISVKVKVYDEAIYAP